VADGPRRLPRLRCQLMAAIGWQPAEWADDEREIAVVIDGVEAVVFPQTEAEIDPVTKRGTVTAWYWIVKPTAECSEVPEVWSSGSESKLPAACWTWSRMGNRRRGIVTRWGTPLVVGPCRFAKLRRAGRVDYPRFARMKGDAWAMQHGCRR
jgi:hypothetical protein